MALLLRKKFETCSYFVDDVRNNSILVCVFQNGNPHSPHCAGIHGILQAYHQTLASVQLYGPTNFSPVINHMARCVRETRERTDRQFFFIVETTFVHAILESLFRNNIAMIWCFCRFAAAYRGGTHYFVLLIITDGVITDMNATKEAIVQVTVLSVSAVVYFSGPTSRD